MDNNIITFKKLVKENNINIPYNEKLITSKGYIGLSYSGKSTHKFYLHAKTNYNQITVANYGYPLFELDEEDLDYLTTKYFKRLDEEKNNRIKEIELEYGNTK